MIRFAEDYCRENYPLHKSELLTGEENHVAQLVYAEYMKVFERMKEFMIQNESIESECVNNYSMIFRKPFRIFQTF